MSTLPRVIALQRRTLLEEMNGGIHAYAIELQPRTLGTARAPTVTPSCARPTELQPRTLRTSRAPTVTPIKGQRRTLRNARAGHPLADCGKQALR
jgi:hypothetical protein